MAFTVNDARKIPGFENYTDAELIKHAKANGLRLDPLGDGEQSDNPEAGAIRSYVGIPLEKGVSDIGGAVGYGLEAAGMGDAGRALQESNRRVQENLTARQSQQAQEDAQKTLIDDNGNYGGYNLGTAVQDITGSIPGVAAMALPGAGLAKVATGVSKAVGIGEKVAQKVAQVASSGPLGKGLAAGIDTAIGSAVGFGASEGAFSGASNAAQLQTEIRHADLNQLAEHPVFQEVLKNETDPSHPIEERMYQAREIIARKAGNDTFADTLVKTGLISMATGGGMFGIIRGNAAKKAAGEAVDGALTRAAKGFVTEGVLQEAPQSALEQQTMNQAKIDYTDQHQDLNQGVLNAGVQGGIAGGVMGMFGAAGGGTHSEGNQPAANDEQKNPDQLALPAPAKQIGEDRTGRVPNETIVFHDGSQISADQFFNDRMQEHGDEALARRQTFMALNGKPKPVLGIPELVFTADGTSLNKADLIRGFTTPQEYNLYTFSGGGNSTSPTPPKDESIVGVEKRISPARTEQEALDYIKHITSLPIRDRTEVNLDPYRFMQDRNAKLLRDSEGLRERAAIQAEQNATTSKQYDDSIPYGEGGTNDDTPFLEIGPTSWEEYDLASQQDKQKQKTKRDTEARQRLLNARQDQKSTQAETQQPETKPAQTAPAAESPVSPATETSAAAGQGDQAPGFVATHTLSDGVPVTHVEGNVYSDANGNEFEDDYAVPIAENTNERGIEPDRQTQAGISENRLPATGDSNGDAGFASKPNEAAPDLSLNKTQWVVGQLKAQGINAKHPEFKAKKAELERQYLEAADKAKGTADETTRTTTASNEQSKPVDRPVSGEAGPIKIGDIVDDTQSTVKGATATNTYTKPMNGLGRVKMALLTLPNGKEHHALYDSLKKSEIAEPIKQPSITHPTDVAGTGAVSESELNKDQAGKPTKAEKYDENGTRLSRLKYRKIGQLENKIAKLEGVQSGLNEQGKSVPGSFVTGRSNQSPSLMKRRGALNDKLASNFKELQSAKDELKNLEQWRKAFEAGEVHDNGQPRADAPSKQEAKKAEGTYADYIKARVKPGDTVTFNPNPQSGGVKVKSINKSTVTLDSGTKWQYSDITPMIDGRDMTRDELKADLKAWSEDQEKPATVSNNAEEVQKPAEPIADNEKPDGANENVKPEPENRQDSEGTPESLIDQHSAIDKRITEGKITAGEMRAEFEALVSNGDAVMAELSKFTKAELEKRINTYVRPDAKKADLVEDAYEAMLTDYWIGEGLFSYSVNFMSKETAAQAKTKKVRQFLSTLTDEAIQKHADEIKQAQKKLEEERKAAVDGMEDPKTLNDYYRLLKAKMAEGVTYDQARMSLSPEQRATVDEMAAEQSRDDRKARADQQKTEVNATATTTSGDIIETKHTKTGDDLFVVKAVDRVERETYNQWNATAKRLGGWYSSYRGAGAVPGFQFKARESAEAFLQYLGGDVTQAKEAIQERRDAYADDKSQSAVERLNEMADRLEDRGEESLNRDRKANTARRAGMATRAEAAARYDVAMAETMRNIAKAISDGKAKFLDRVRTKAQIEMLQSFVNVAQGDKIRAQYDSYLEQERHKGEKPDGETADYAKFPDYTAFRSDLASLARGLAENDGTKKIGQELLKVADDVDDIYLKWAKENLSKVNITRTEGGLYSAFKSKSDAEEVIRRANYKGKAVILPVKRGENVVILSPSEAMKRGIWEGDHDKRVTLSKEFGAELVEKIGKAARRNKQLSVPWQFEYAYDKQKRLSAMGIETRAELRAALREFIGLSESPKEADKIKEMERSMIGRANDGLDFFPTPAGVAEQMIEAADIKPGMRVLEPSAGMGHIAEKVRDAGVDPEVIELSNKRRELLEAKGFNVVGNDFIDFNDIDHANRSFTFGDVFKNREGKLGVMRGSGGMGSNRVGFYYLDEGGNPSETRGTYENYDELEPVERRGVGSGYDRIVMNPPFGDRRDAAHVMHAYDLLKPGGRLIAIMGEGVFFGTDKKAQAFRDWLEERGGTDEKLEEGTFNDPSLPVTTGVNARMVVIDKPESAQKTQSEEVKFSKGEPYDYTKHIEKRLEDAERELRTNQLTGIPNHRAFMEKDAPAYVAAIDVDSLKYINDSMGHQAGNDLLKAVARVLREHVDTYHVSGDELLARGDSLAALQKGLEDAQDELKSGKYTIASDHAYFNAPGFSYGIAKIGKGDDKRTVLDAAVKDADEKMLDHKTEREKSGERAARGEMPQGFHVTKEGEARHKTELPVRPALNTYKDPLAAQAALVKEFGSGVNRLVLAGILNFTYGKTSWPDSARLQSRSDEEAVYVGGKAYIDLQATDKSRLSSVLLHEIGEHYHLKRMIGEDAYNELQSRITNLAMVKGSEASKAWKAVAKFYPDLRQGSEAFVSEVIAKLGETSHNEPWYKQLISKIKAFLIKHLMGKSILAGTMKESDIHALLVASLHGAASRKSIKAARFYDSWEARASISDNEADTNNEVRFSRPATQLDGLREKITNSVIDHMESSRTFNALNRTVNTQAFKASKDKYFKKVFDKSVAFEEDVARFANAAADMAKTLLPELDETLNPAKVAKDIKAGYQRNKDAQKVSDAIFQTTLDEKPMKWADLKAAGYTDQQAKMYQEFFAAVNKSLDDLVKSEMFRAARALKIEKAPDNLSIKDAAEWYAEQSPDINTAKEFIDKAEKIKELKDKGYAPLMRFGQYTVSVYKPSSTGEEELDYFGMYETQAEANQDKRLLESDPQYKGARITSGVMSQNDWQMFKGVTPETMEVFAKLANVEQDDAFQQYLKLAVNNRSAMKRLIHRKKMKGFKADPQRVLATFITSNARMASKNYHLGDMVDAIAAIPKEKGDVKDEAVDLYNYVQNPGAAGAGIRSLMFSWYLGGSIASAGVNLTQTFTTTFPYLHQFGNTSKVAKEIKDAMRLAINPEKITGELGAALKMADEEGVTAPHELHMLYGESMRTGMTAFKSLRPLAKAWGSLFSTTEAYNRRVAFIAAYSLGKGDKQARFEFASKAVNETQFQYNKSNRPNWARSTIGSTLFTFRTFTLSYLELLRKLPPQERMIALGVLVLLAGAGGLPGADDADDIIDTVGQGLGYNTNSKAWKDEFIPEFLLNGISSFLPIDVGSRLGVGNIIPGSAIFKKTETDKSRDVMEFIGPVGSMASRIKDAVDAAESREGVLGPVGAIAKTMVPKAFQDAMQAADMWQTGHYRDSKGRNVADVDGWDAFWKGIGIQPTSVSDRRKKERILNQSITMAKTVESEIADLWAQGVFEKDNDKVAEAKSLLKKWNARNEDTPIVIKMNQITRRLKQMRMTSGERLMKTTPKEMRRFANESM